MSIGTCWRNSPPLALTAMLAACFLAAPPAAKAAAQEEPAGKKLIRDLGCPACHEIKEHQTTIQGEAPDLTSEGDKVRPEWLFTFLKSPSALRPWLRGRMPDFRFTDEEALAVTEYLLTLKDPAIPSGSAAPLGKASRDALGAGERLLSKDYFDCLSCHQQGEKKPEGTPDGWAPDLAFARARLKPEWIVQWLRDPQKVQAGTKMPSFFPGGPADILGGDEEKQIHALRDYLLNLGIDSPDAYKGTKEKFFQATAAMGQRLVVASNCAGCHKIGSLARTLRPGPPLSWEGSKVREPWLLSFLKQPHPIRPQAEARMPSFRLTDAEARALTAYIRESLNAPAAPRHIFRPGEVTPALIAEGKRLFEGEVGCRTCHRIEKEGALGGPELTGIASRLEEGWLFHWIRDPKRFDAHAPMPKVGLTDGEAKAVAAYLLHRQAPKASARN